MIGELISFRHQLHQYPELSGKEKETARRVIEFITPYQPTQIIQNIGGYGIAILYEFGQTGRTIAVRCELDALPIEENNPLSYQSTYKGISHKCGHDGHMTIVAGLSQWLNAQNFKNGNFNYRLSVS